MWWDLAALAVCVGSGLVFAALGRTPLTLDGKRCGDIPGARGDDTHA